ncbi:MAG: phosphate acyltransferase, partial [Planctomycetota bacterium]
MNVLSEIRERARRKNARIVLPEAADERVLRAATILKSEGLVQPVLVAARGMDPIIFGRACPRGSFLEVST